MSIGWDTCCFLDFIPSSGRFQAMAERTVQLVLHYDGSGFSGWQRQPEQRTVQSVVEQALDRDALDSAATSLLGEHSFRAFAVKGTAPESDEHRCDVRLAHWDDRPGG